MNGAVIAGIVVGVLLVILMFLSNLKYKKGKGYSFKVPTNEEYRVAHQYSNRKH